MDFFLLNVLFLRAQPFMVYCDYLGVFVSLPSKPASQLLESFPPTIFIFRGFIIKLCEIYVEYIQWRVFYFYLCSMPRMEN